MGIFNNSVSYGDDISVESDFKCVLITESPIQSMIDVSDLVTGMELYGNMFDNQIWYGVVRLFDEKASLIDNTNGASMYLIIETHGTKSTYKVLKSKYVKDALSGDIYTHYMDFVSIQGFYLLKERYIYTPSVASKQDNGLQISDIIYSYMMSDNDAYKIDSSTGVLDMLYPCKLNTKACAETYNEHISCDETIGVFNLKNIPNFKSRIEQINYLSQFATPKGNNDITNTINDYWTFQKTPDSLCCVSISKLLKKDPIRTFQYGGLPESTLLSNDVRCTRFELLKSPNNTSSQKSVSVNVDPLCRNVSFYTSDVNKIKDNNGNKLGNSTIKISGGETAQEIVYSFGANSDIRSKVEIIKKSKENDINFVDYKRLTTRNDFFKSLLGFYAVISINRGASDLSIGDIIKLKIYKDSGTEKSAEELDERFSGKWLIVNKGIHISSDKTSVTVFGIVKDSVG